MEINNNGFNNLKLRGLIIPIILIGIAFTVTYSIDEGPFGDILTAYMVYAVIFLWIFHKFRKTKINYPKLIGKIPKKHQILEIITLTIFTLVLGIGSASILLYISLYFNLSFLLDFLNQPLFYTGLNSIYYNTLLFLMAVLFAPVVEELLFRGIILHRFAVKWGINVSIILSSLLFGILHADLLGSFMFGVIMSIIYIQTQTLWAPILCHILNNFIACTLELTIGNLDQLNAISDLWIGIICLAIAAPYITRYLYKNWPKKITDLPYFHT